LKKAVEVLTKGKDASDTASKAASNTPAPEQVPVQNPLLITK
jgi:hypothetical protein